MKKEKRKKEKKRSKSVAAAGEDGASKSSSLVRPLVLRHSDSPSSDNLDPIARGEAERAELRAALDQARSDADEVASRLQQRLEERDSEVAELEERLARVKRRREAESAQIENESDQLQLDLAQATAENKALKLRLGVLEDAERARNALAAEVAALREEAEVERRRTHHRLHQADKDALARAQRLREELGAEVEEKAAESRLAALRIAEQTSADILQENKDLSSRLESLELELSSLRSANLHLRVRLESYSEVKRGQQRKVPRNRSKETSSPPPPPEPNNNNNQQTQPPPNLLSKMEEERDRERKESSKRIGNLTQEVERLQRITSQQRKEMDGLRLTAASAEEERAAAVKRLSRLSSVALGPLNGDRLPSLALLAEAMAE